MLHETNWEPPEEMKQPYTEKQIEAMQKKLDDRGGSKKETVFDVIKREKWKMRVKMVMNQKANSIADLAAILLRQEEKGVKTAEQKAEAGRRQRVQDIETMIHLAGRYANGEMADLVNTIKTLEAELLEAQRQAQNKEFNAKIRKVHWQKALRTKREIEDMQLLARKTEWSANAVKIAKTWAESPTAARQAEADGWQELSKESEQDTADVMERRRALDTSLASSETSEAREQLQADLDVAKRRRAKFRFAKNMAEQKRNWNEVALKARFEGLYDGEFGVSEQPATTRETDASMDAASQTGPQQTQSKALEDFRDYLPNFPAELDPVAAARAGLLVDGPKSKKSYGKDLHNMIKIAKSSVFTAQGVSVKWANILDAEYAEVWPEAVQHERLGFVRNTAPRPDLDAHDQVSDFKAAQWKKRAANWETGQPEAVDGEGYEVVANAEGSEERKAVINRIRDQLVASAKGKGHAPMWKVKQRERKEDRKNANRVRHDGGQPKADAQKVQDLQAASEPPVQGDAPRL